MNRSEQKGDRAIRQLGFQETDIIPMAGPITKAAFNEKRQVEGGWISGGLYRVDEDFRLWQPMDTYQEFMLLSRLWSEGHAPWKI